MITDREGLTYELHLFSECHVGFLSFISPIAVFLCVSFFKLPSCFSCVYHRKNVDRANHFWF